MEFSNINFLTVLVGGVAAFVLGSLWYSVFFGKAWQRLLDLTDESLQKGNMAVIMISSFVLMTIMSFGLALLIQGHTNPNSEVDAISGLYHGLVVGLVFVGMSVGINYLYQRRSFKLWLIDAGYQILFLGLQGLILGAWQ